MKSKTVKAVQSKSVKAVAKHAEQEDKRHQSTAAKKAKAAKAKAAKAKAAKPTAPVKLVPGSKRDALGSRPGTDAAKINSVIILAAGKGATCSEIVAATKVDVTAVSMQARACLARGTVTRTEDANGKFRYFAVAPVAQKGAA